MTSDEDIYETATTSFEERVSDLKTEAEDVSVIPAARLHVLQAEFQALSGFVSSAHAYFPEKYSKRISFEMYTAYESEVRGAILNHLSIIGKHEDGRILVMARHHFLAPMIKKGNRGKWGPAKISGREVDEFDEVTDYTERDEILRDARFRSPESLRLPHPMDPRGELRDNY